MKPKHKHRFYKRQYPFLIALSIVSLLLCFLGLYRIGTNRHSKNNPISDMSTTSATQEAHWTVRDTPVYIPILMYHAIHDIAPGEEANENLIVSPAVFESHVKALKEAGYYFLTPEEAYRAFTENSLPADKVVWLTFDDSVWDFYDQAFPILQKYQATATNNVITGTVGSDANLSLSEIKRMKAAGLSFQSHTVNHPDLASVTLDDQTLELANSKTFLDTQLDQATMTIAYPSGSYTYDTLSIAESQGYQLGLTTNEGFASADNGLLSLNRIRILPTTTAENLITSIAME